MVLNRFFGSFRKERSVVEDADRVLPSDVRYALQYREGQLGREDIRDLARNGFENEALYLLIKAVEFDPELQRNILTDISQLFLEERASGAQEKDPHETLKDYMMHTIGRLPQGVSIKGGKLAQISRQGFKHWWKIYTKAAEEQAHTSAPTYLVGYATLVGLVPFIAAFVKTGKPLHILIPARINDPESRVCGYRIQGGVVEDIKKGFERDSHAVIIDDTKNTGNSIKNIEEFWSAGGKYPTPRTEFLSISPNGLHS